eukprot:COSAG05_NODE_428_length_9890_cov_4.534470_7_plen_917_part_00
MSALQTANEETSTLAEEAASAISSSSRHLEMAQEAVRLHTEKQQNSDATTELVNHIKRVEANHKAGKIKMRKHIERLKQAQEEKDHAHVKHMRDMEVAVQDAVRRRNQASKAHVAATSQGERLRAELERLQDALVQTQTEAQAEAKVYASELANAETDKKALSDAHDIRLDLVNGELAAINQKFIDLQMAADEQSGTLGSDSVIKRQNAKDATLKMEKMHELEMRKFQKTTEKTVAKIQQESKAAIQEYTEQVAVLEARIQEMEQQAQLHKSAKDAELVLEEALSGQAEEAQKQRVQDLERHQAELEHLTAESSKREKELVQEHEAQLLAHIAAGAGPKEEIQAEIADAQRAQRQAERALAEAREEASQKLQQGDTENAEPDARVQLQLDLEQAKAGLRAAHEKHELGQAELENARVQEALAVQDARKHLVARLEQEQAARKLSESLASSSASLMTMEMQLKQSKANATSTEHMARMHREAVEKLRNQSAGGMVTHEETKLKLQNAREDISRLRSELAEVRNEGSVMIPPSPGTPQTSTSDVAAVATQMAAKQKQRKALEKMEARYDKEVKRLTKVANNLKSDKDLATANERQIRDQFERLSQQVSADQHVQNGKTEQALGVATVRAEEIEHLRESVGALQSELATAYAQTLVEPEELERHRALFETELNEANAECSAISDKNLSLTKTQKQLAAETEQAKAELALAQGELESQLEVLASERSTIAQLQAEQNEHAAALDASLAQLRAAEEDAEQQKARFDTQLQSVHESDMTQSQKLSQVETALKDARIEQQTAAQERTRLIAEGQGQRTQLESLDARMRELQHGAAESEAQQSELRATNNAMARELEESKKELRNKDRELQLVAQKLQMQRQQLASMPSASDLTRQKQVEERMVSDAMYGNEMPASFKKKGKRK